LVHVKILRADSDGIHRCLEDLFTVLGRDSDRLSSLEGLDFLTHGHGLMSASLTEDPLEVEEWWNHVIQNDAVSDFAERCRRLDFRDQRANIIFGRRMQKLRENDQVELFMELVQHLLAHRPSNHELWLELGRLHEQRQEYDDAWLCYDHVQSLRPTSPERDKLLSRLTLRMDSTGGWSPPVEDIRSKFLKKMEELAAEVSGAGIDEVSDDEVEGIDPDMVRLQNLLQAGDGEEAFFLARRLVAGGEEWARTYLEQATALLK